MYGHIAVGMRVLETAEREQGCAVEEEEEEQQNTLGTDVVWKARIGLIEQPTLEGGESHVMWQCDVTHVSTTLLAVAASAHAALKSSAPASSHAESIPPCRSHMRDAKARMNK
jgi:hypothetical protein